MSENVREVIAVEEVKEGKFGPYAKVNGVYYNKGKQFLGDFNDMKAGSSYEVEVYTTSKGGKYIQKLIALVSAGKITVAPKTETKMEGAIKSAAVKPSRDYDAEARGKTRCALMEAALQSPALPAYAINGFEEYKNLLREAADYAYAYVFPEDSNV